MYGANDGNGLHRTQRGCVVSSLAHLGLRRLDEGTQACRVTGRSRITMSSGASASSIAETIAAGAPIVPLSAAPFTPSG